MAGSGIGRKTTRAFLKAIMIALVVMGLGPVSAALALEPEVTIDSPAKGSAVNELTPEFKGKTTDHTATDEVVVEIEGPKAGEVQPSVSTPPTSEGSWSVRPPALVNGGSYTIKAKQVEAATLKEGGSGYSVSFSVDTTKPTVTLNPLNAEEGTASPSFSGTAGTEAGDGAVTLKVYRGNEAVGTPLLTVAAKSSAGKWSTGAVALPEDGTYTAIAEQTDSAKNIGLSEKSTFTVKTEGPTVTLNAVAPWTSNAPSFSGSAGSTAMGDKDVILEICPGTSCGQEGAAPAVVKQSVVPSGSTWASAPVTPLPDGTYTAVALQQDGVGNVGRSVAEKFTVDTTPPQISLTTPAVGTGVQPVSGSAGTAPGDLPGVTIQLFAGGAVAGSPIETIGVNESGGAWSAALAGLGGGVYTVRAFQSDEAGNVGFSAPSTFTVVAASLAAPFASFTWVPTNPSPGQNVSLISASAGVSSPITAYAWDPAGNGHFAAAGPIYVTSFPSVGAHTVHLRVTDADGLSSTATETVNVTNAPAVLMQPFPIVRIAGSVTSYGARVNLLSVQAPLSTNIAISCKGRGCKTKNESRLALASKTNKSKGGAVTLTFGRFERPLRAGAVLQIRVTKAGQIGKYTSFKIRSHKLPVRSDACLGPTNPTPVGCPS